MEMTTEPQVDTESQPELANGVEPKPTVTTIMGAKKRSVLARDKADRGKEAGELEGETDETKEKESGLEVSKEMLALKNADHLAVREWLDGLSAQTAIRIEVRRQSPKMFRDPQTGREVQVGGHLKNYDQVISEEDVQQAHGGGTFQIIVKIRNKRGQWSYFNARTIEIAGDPKLDDVPRAFTPPSQPQQTPGPDPMTQNLMGKAFDFMADAANRANNRPPMQQGAAGADITRAVEAAIAPLQATIQMLTQQLAQKDQEMRLIREQAAKGDPYKDTLLDKLMDTDNARLQAVRIQYDSEIRMLKEQAIQNENRLRDQHQRDLDRLERAHERELASAKSSAEVERRALEGSQGTTKMVLDAEVRRLEKENTELKSELSTLRNKKDPTLAEKIREMKDLKELVNDDDEDEEEKGTLEKVLEAAGGLPIMSALAARIEGGGAGAQQAAAAAQQAQQIQMQPAKPRKLVRNRATGAVMAPQADGSLKPVQRVVPSPDGNSQVQIPPVDPAMVKQAIDYMTSAFTSGTKPEDFADSARPMVPQSVLGAIRALGIDEFMSKVAQLDGTSPLATQSGRNWRRRVANRLLGEADDA